MCIQDSQTPGNVSVVPGLGTTPVRTRTMPGWSGTLLSYIKAFLPFLEGGGKDNRCLLI